MQDRAKPSGQFGAGLPQPLIRVFFEVNETLMVHLLAAIEAGDVATALKAAHAIKGAGLFAGFRSLAEAASALEISLRARRWNEAEARVLRLERLLHGAETRAFG